MTDDLRTRIAAVLDDEMFKRDAYTEYGTDGEPGQWYRVDGHINLTALADAVIREITEAIPPIVASAIQGYAQSELVAITHHGEAGEYEMLKRLNSEALRIALYATTHEDWND